MANLAIKGHATRGDEVIEILKMLGGIDWHGYAGNRLSSVYYISENKAILFDDIFDNDFKEKVKEFIIFDLEEFEEKFPYKVGDKVELNGIGVEITGMYWIDNTINYEGESIKLGSKYDCLSVQDLKPYKEEITEDKEILVKIDLTKELCVTDEVEVILGDYEFVLKNGKTYFVKKKPKYPKTYEECCNLLGIEDRENGYCGYEYELLGEFQKLLICRNAYWKIAGEQMGLGKPWSPDWRSVRPHKFGIYTFENQIRYITLYVLNNLILVFPTEEMRDAFYDNFKELIEHCKELL